MAAFELASKLRGASSNLDVEENPLLARVATTPATPELTDRVAAPLGESKGDNSAAPDGLQGRLRAIADECSDLRAAIAMAEARLTKAKYRASRAICDEARPSYKVAVETLAAAFVAAHNAHSALLEITNQWTALDVAWTSYITPMQAANIFGKRSGRIAAWLREAANAAVIEKAKFPLELKS